MTTLGRVAVPHRLPRTSEARYEVVECMKDELLDSLEGEVHRASYVDALASRVSDWQRQTGCIPAHTRRREPASRQAEM